MNKSGRFPSEAIPRQCPDCKNKSWGDASLTWTLYEFVWLYLIGVYELIRQIMLHRLHAHRFLPSKAEQASCGEPGYIVILSGATSGIGREIRKELHQRGVRLLLLTHPLEAGPFPENEEVLVDFSSYDSTRRGAKRLRGILSQDSRNSDVVFFHCAGIYNPRMTKRKRSLSLRALQTCAVNTVMPALFLQSVSDLLTSVVYVGSSSQKVAPSPTYAQCPFRLAKSPYGAYPLSKMLTLAYIERWSCINRKSAIVIHPGVVATNLYKNEQGFVGTILRTVLRFSALSADESARRVLQILDQTKFFKKMSTRQFGHHDMNHSGICWDAATMAPAVLPYQIASTRLRTWLFEHISGVLHCWTDS